MMTSLDEASAPGVPLGRYRLIALLGQGGMADVYLACTQGAGGFRKLLVVKLARFTGEPLFATMFLSEARLAAQLSHPNIIQTFEIGEEGTHRYIVMEYLDGGNLAHVRQRLAKHGGVPLRISLHILLEVLEGLEYAYEAPGIDGRALRIVHRDLSPSNIMCTTQGAVKILDFGIAKAADSARLTQTGKFSGKLQYMPPEQVRGEQVDARADLFAVGVMLAEAALGQGLWGTMATAAIAIELSAGRIPSLDRGAPLHPSLRQICQKALAPDRAYRYASARELKQDLAAFATTLGPPVSPRELAELVRTAIESDRAKLQVIIDSQLQRLGSSSKGLAGTLLDLPRVEHTPTNLPELAAGQAIKIDSSGPSERADKTQPTAPSEALRRRPARWIALAGPALVVAVAGGIWAARSGARGDVAPAKATPETAAPATVRFEVVVQPADATLSLDGQPLGVNPFVGELARDTALHRLAASAPGYQPSVQMVTLERDASFHLSLAKAAPVSEAPTAAPPAPPTSAVATPEAVEPAGGLRHAVIAPPGGPRPHPAWVRPSGPKAPPPSSPPPPPPPPVEARARPPGDGKRALDTSALDAPATGKRALDTGVLDAPAAGKRALDTDVLDSGSNKPKPALDRETPWGN
jgi:eukaryotic-like serine/threonine-protein kinase